MSKLLTVEQLIPYAQTIVKTLRKRFFHFASLVFFLSGLYHLIGIFYPSFTEPASTTRHIVFVLICVFFSIGMWKQGKAILLAFVPYLIQQLHSHRVYGLEVWNTQHRIDWASVGVFIFLPITFIFLLIDSRNV